MPIHVGKKIKEEVYRQRISITAFARKISRSRNVVYDIFERESVDTDLLNKIGKVLNCDFFSLYSAQKEYSLEGMKNFNAKEPETNYSKNSQENTLQHQNQLLKNEVAYLKKIITIMEGKKQANNQKKPGRKK